MKLFPILHRAYCLRILSLYLILMDYWRWKVKEIEQRFDFRIFLQLPQFIQRSITPVRPQTQGRSSTLMLRFISRCCPKHHALIGLTFGGNGITEVYRWLTVRSLIGKGEPRECGLEGFSLLSCLPFTLSVSSLSCQQLTLLCHILLLCHTALESANSGLKPLENVSQGKLLLF